MPFIRSLTFKHCALLVITILLLSKIMLFYSYDTKKDSICQPFFCLKCTKINIYLSCNIYLISNIKYTRFIYF